MPISRFIKESSFGPDEIEVIVRAFEGVCKELQLYSRNDPVTEIVAEKVIKAAAQGAKDVADLQQRALQNVRQ